jgi:hypothetical protein
MLCRSFFMWFSGFCSCTTFAPSSSSIFLCCPLFDDSHILIFISYFCLLLLNYHILVLFFIGPNNIIVYILYSFFMLGYPCLIFFSTTFLFFFVVCECFHFPSFLACFSSLMSHVSGVAAIVHSFCMGNQEMGWTRISCLLSVEKKE